MNWINTIAWEAVSAIATCVEIIVIFIPALLYFLYSKISYVHCWSINETNSGMKIILHNKSRNSLYLLNLSLIVKGAEGRHTCQLDADSLNTNYSCIEPDSSTPINIDYEIHKIKPSDKLTLQISFGGKRRKKYKKIKRSQIN